jgi:hypothetical protein
VSTQTIGPQDHVVQFYDEETRLASAVGLHLAEGLRRGEVAVVIASPAHTALIEDQLAQCGIDLPAAGEEGRYVALDAAAALAELMDGDLPDPVRFDDAIGGVIRSALERGPVRAFGEMVALLWTDGLIPAAVELEVLWNDLRARVPFSLFCAYPHSTVAADDSGRFSSVCHLHSEVLGSGAPRRRPATGDADPRVGAFACSVDSLRTARAFVAEVLGDWGQDSLGDDAAVIVTELAANAVLHAQTGFTVTLVRVGHGVEISDEDGARDVPWPRTPPADATSGRGMRLVAALSDDWGTELGATGKTVWAELARSHTALAARA